MTDLAEIPVIDVHASDALNNHALNNWHVMNNLLNIKDERHALIFSQTSSKVEN